MNGRHGPVFLERYGLDWCFRTRNEEAFEVNSRKTTTPQDEALEGEPDIALKSGIPARE